MENKDFINHIPSHKNPSPDYYCTWQTQLYATSGGTPAPFPKTATSLRMSGGSTVKTKIYTEGEIYVQDGTCIGIFQG